MRRKLVAGNWKMNGRLGQNAELLSQLRLWADDQPKVQDGLVELLFCVPFAYLAQAAEQLQDSPLLVGAQTLSEFPEGAYTGEVSARMLLDFGCRYVIVGHSERRQIFNETNVQIAQKVQAAMASGLVPILCVGETLNQREAGETLAVVFAQLDAVFQAIPENQVTEFVVAYEPVWAIGTGKTATPDQAQQVHAAIRAKLAEKHPDLGQKTLILYGGSVKAENASSLFSQPDIDGGLVGGASLNARDFIEICKAVA